MTKVFCPECGKPITDDITKICSNCGSKLPGPGGTSTGITDSQHTTAEQQIPTDPKKSNKSVKYVCIGCIGVIVLFFIIALAIPFFDNIAKSRTSCQFLPCNGQNCITDKNTEQFPYTVYASSKTLVFDLEKQLYSYTNCRSRELGTRSVKVSLLTVNKKSTFKYGDKEFYLRYIDDPRQKTALTSISQKIKDETLNPDDQARIAVSLVQNIPYKDIDINGPIKLPYEVLYTNSGDCDEKSLLLAFLLRDLGYNVSLFLFNDWKHMAVGIKVPSGFDYKHTGYAYVETTRPWIISHDALEYGYGETGNPDIILISEGREFGSIQEEYIDAQNLQKLINSNKKNGTLFGDEKTQILELVNKYGMSITYS